MADAIKELQLFASTPSTQTAVQYEPFTHPDVHRVFPARITGAGTDGSRHTWQELIVASGNLEDYGGGIACTLATDDSAASEINGGTNVTAGTVVYMLEIAATESAYRYVFAVPGVSSVTVKLDDAGTTGLGGGVYAGFIVIGSIPSTVDPNDNEAMPMGMTVSSLLCYYVNTDEDGQNTHLLNTSSFVHGTARGFSAGGLPIIVGESVNEEVSTNLSELLDGSASDYTADAANWRRTVKGTVSPNFGGIPFKLTTPTRIDVRNSLSGSPPTAGTIEINQFKRLLTVGACGRFFKVDAEAKSLLLALPDFDLTTAPVAYSHTQHTRVWGYDKDTNKWVRLTAGEVTLGSVRVNGTTGNLQRNAVTLHGIFDYSEAGWADIAVTDLAIDSVSATCNADSTITLSKTDVTVFAPAP
jgi:hypothetical protein